MCLLWFLSKWYDNSIGSRGYSILTNERWRWRWNCWVRVDVYDIWLLEKIYYPIDRIHDVYDFCDFSFLVYPSVSSFHSTDTINTGVIINDALSIFKLVNYLINYSIHRNCYHWFYKILVGETMLMTQIISSFPFSHCSWIMANPVFKKNVFYKNNKTTSFYFSLRIDD